MMGLRDYWNRDDLPDYFVEGEISDAVRQFDENPQDVLYATLIWDIEAEARTKGLRRPDDWVFYGGGEPPYMVGSGQDIANVLFFGLSRRLTVYGDHIGLSVPRIWEFYCVSTDGVSEIPSEHKWASWHTGLEKAYEFASGDILRVQSAVEILHEKNSYPIDPKERKQDGFDCNGVFWQGGRPHQLTNQNVKLLRCVYDSQCVEFADVGEFVWGNQTVSDNTIRSLVTRLNAQLKKHQIPLSYKCDKGSVIRDS